MSLVEVAIITLLVTLAILLSVLAALPPRRAKWNFGGLEGHHWWNRYSLRLEFPVEEICCLPVRSITAGGSIARAKTESWAFCPVSLYRELLGDRVLRGEIGHDLQARYVLVRQTPGGSG